jgi:predicted ATPase
MVNSTPSRTGSTRAELKGEFTLVKLAFELSASFLGAGLVWLYRWVTDRDNASLRDYLWPQGALVFFVLLAMGLVIDNLRLRQGRKSTAAGPAVVPTPQDNDATPPVQRHPNALDESAVEGRKDEIEQVVAFILSNERSFLCLHGPGGVGKTTVARAALGRLGHLRAAFVPVETVEERGRDPQAVEQAFAVAVATQGLGVPLVARDSPVEAVSNVLRLLDTRTVLIIDNVEQVAGRAAPLIDRWVQESPLARVIVTSRRELEVGTERVVEVDVFPSHARHLQPADILRDPGPALRLFERRRKARQPRFRLLENNVLAANRICEAVGGLPLGIELAAAVERTLAEIEQGINKSSAYLKSSRSDLPDRQRSLAATIDWSLHLLEPDCRALALQLSVAAGPLDDEAVAGIASIPGRGRGTQALLSTLVGTALVVRGENGEHSHYREPVEVRRRCAEVRHESPDAETRGAWGRFAATFAARAGRAYAQRYGPGVRQTLDILERDYANLAAIAHCAEPTDPVLAGRVGVYLAWFTSVRRPSEPRMDTLAALLDQTPAAEHALVAQLRTGLAVACLDRWARTGENLREQALTWAQRGVEAAERAGDPVILGEAHRTLGLSAMRANQSDLAASGLGAAAKHFIQARQFAAAAAVYARWSFLPITRGEEQHEQARRLLAGVDSPIARFELLLADLDQWQQSQTTSTLDLRSITRELRDIATQIDSDSMRLRALHAAALVESELDDQDRALEVLDEKAQLCRTAGAMVELGITLSDMAAVLLRRHPLPVETLDRAICLLDEALLHLEGVGLQRHVAILRCNRAWALLGRGDPREALVDSATAMEYFDELTQWEPLNAFIAACVHARILLEMDDAVGATEWMERAHGLAKEHHLNESSPSPEIRQHARWLCEHRADGASAVDPIPAPPTQD